MCYGYKNKRVRDIGSYSWGLGSWNLRLYRCFSSEILRPSVLCLVKVAKVQ